MDENITNETSFNPTALNIYNHPANTNQIETPVVYSKKKVGRPKGVTSANKVIKKSEKFSTSSSGYPGVSWNKRMCAWLAFFYDGASRRSRTFHPKHFNMDKEKARLAAVEFMKTVENNGRKKSSKTKAGKNKGKNLNDNSLSSLHHNNNNLNGVNTNNNNIQMQLMSMNPSFYMQNLNRNMNISNISGNERNNLNSTFNSLNSSNLNNIPKSMQDQNALYMHNTLFNNIHLLNNSNTNLTTTTPNNNNNNNNNNATASVATTNTGNSTNNPNNDNNNLHYLNDLIFHTNLLQGSLGFPDGNVNDSSNGILNLDDNMGLHNKDVENLMDALFRQNYNMNLNLSNIDKHFLQNNNQVINPSMSNNNNSTTNNNSSSSATNNNNFSSINNNSSQNHHLYLPNTNNTNVNSSNNNSSNGNNNSSHNTTANELFENNNESNNSQSNISNFYDYNLDLYRGNLSPYILDIVHRMNNELKEEKTIESINDDPNDSNFRLIENNAWINQLRHTHGNLCNNLNKNHCELCHTVTSTSPQNLKNQMELCKRKKSNSISFNNRKNELLEENGNTFDLNIPCNCSSQIRNQKNHFCVYYNQSNSSSQNENYNYLGWNANSNNNLINNIEKNDDPVDNSNNNKSINDASIICLTNNNQNESHQHNSKHLSQNINLNPKPCSNSMQYSNNHNLPEIQKQIHFQNQQGINQEIHNPIHLTDKQNTFSQKGLNDKKKTSKEHRKIMLNQINLPQTASKKNQVNSSFGEHNNLCTKLNSIINFEWINSDLKLNRNGNKQNSFDKNVT